MLLLLFDVASAIKIREGKLNTSNFFWTFSGQRNSKIFINRIDKNVGNTKRKLRSLVKIVKGDESDGASCDRIEFADHLFSSFRLSTAKQFLKLMSIMNYI